MILAALLLLLQAVPLLSTRWVADESWYTAPAHSLATTGELRIRAFPSTSGQGRVESSSPLFMVVLAGIFKLLGTSLYTARLQSLLSGIAGILLTYLLGCELQNRRIGLLAAVFLATDNMYVMASRTARQETMTTVFALAGVLLYLYSSRRKSVGLAFLSGLAIGGAVQVHPHGLAAALAIGVLAFLEFRLRIVCRARPWAFAAALLLSLVPFLWWANSNPAYRQDFVHMYASGELHPLSEIPSLELSRYADFLGMPSSRFRMGIPVPYRLHVVLALLAAVFCLYRYNRPLLWKLMCFILPYMLWWAYIRNPSVRYTATASPYFAILLAGAALALWDQKPAWRRMVAAVAVLLFVAQVGSNYALLYLYRKANYVQLADRLHGLIPRDATVYGSLVFWMAFHDQPYYSFNRTPLQYALDHGASYLILNDTIMATGSGYGEDDWRSVRQSATDYVRTQATLVGRAPNPYYGDLEIYRVNNPKPVPRQP